MAMRPKEKLRKKNPRGAVDEVVGTLSEETVERLAIQPGQTAASLMADGSRRFPPPWCAQDPGCRVWKSRNVTGRISASEKNSQPLGRAESGEGESWILSGAYAGNGRRRGHGYCAVNWLIRP